MIDKSLKPCPFCNSFAEWNNSAKTFSIQCSAEDDKCGGRPSTPDCFTKIRAVVFWEYRSSEIEV